ncbi:ABC transporter substrate-binding protein [Sciscionella marina]|uniref:ABC transporter substrate-binding protein n=1 Tax=Sciscionella marina TaxID=508770 RepID=UPI000369626A|nr:ABC transporter substrate-binding protein [Sciscionella marina]
MTARRQSRRDALRLGGLATLAPLLGACGVSAAEPRSRVLRVSQPDEAKTLDPQKQGDMPSMNVLINMFDTLTTRGTDNRLGPGLATSWSVLDEQTWRFHLRPGVRFHNGEPCDAHAVQYSLDRLRDPATHSPIVELRYVDGATVVDPLTVDVHTSKHDPILPAKVSLFGGVAVPPRYLDEVGPERFARDPVGTGPFRFVSWQRDHELRMRAFPGHWSGRPKLAELVFKPMPNPASALAALQSDEVDMVTQLTPDAARQLAGYGGVRIENFPGMPTYYLSLNTREGPLADRRVRQALNHAVDVPLLVKAVLDGKAREVPTMFPREANGFDPAIPAYTRDIRRARQLLAEAGYPNGLDTRLTASNADSQVAEAIAGLLAHAGVRAKVTVLDPSTYKSRLTSSNSGALGPIYLAKNTGWTGDAESLVQSNIRHDRRQSRWHDPRADRLIDIEESAVDPRARMRAFTELQWLLHTEAPFVFLFQLDNILARNDRPRWRPNAVGVLDMDSAEVTG